MKRRTLVVGAAMMPFAALADGRNDGNPPEISAWIGRAKPMADSQQEYEEWEDRQYRQGGTNEFGSPASPMHCCGHADAHIVGVDLKDDSFRVADEMEAKSGARYYAKISGEWYPIYEYQLVRNPVADPNPVGKTVVFYGYNGMYKNGIVIYCCSPWVAGG